MNTEKAIQFAKNNGDEVEQARLNYILAEERPSEKVIANLFAGQRSDGGWSPFWAENYSSLDATCFRLAQAEQLGIPQSEGAIVQAVNFLVQRQSSEGYWEEDGNVVDSAPPWAKPGDLSAKLYLTTNCGLWLALLGNPDNLASSAAEYVEKYFEPNGQLPSFLHTHWLAAGLWHKLGWQVSTRVLEYLRTRIGDLATSNLSWLITTLYAAGIPTRHPLIEKAAALLEQSQHGDGSWKSEDGASQNVHATLEALRALSLCGRAVK